MSDMPEKGKIVFENGSENFIEALKDFNTAKVPCVDEDGCELNPQPLARDFLKFGTIEVIQQVLTRADTPTSNRVGYEARCADCNRFLQSEETCSCSPTSAERKAEDRRRRHALMGMPDFHTHYQIHGKWAQAHHEAIRAALQQPDTSEAVRVLMTVYADLANTADNLIERAYGTDIPAEWNNRLKAVTKARSHPAVIAAMKGGGE